jgi:hypothetical protein
MVKMKRERINAHLPVGFERVILYIFRMNRGTVLLFLFLAIGCADAPRDNPLDPLSPGYVSQATLTGVVLLKNIGSPISLARVLVLEDGLSVTSDSAGRFWFPRLPAGPLTVVCTKAGCSPDTQHVVLADRVTESLTFLLNGAPIVLQKKILTRKIDQYYPSPQYYIDVSADVTDPNGIIDLDSVSFTVSTYAFPMVYDPTLRQFLVRVFKYDFPTNTIEWLVGKPLGIVSRDLSGARDTCEAFYVTRIIETGATPVYPSSFNNDTTSGTPLLKWLTSTDTFTYSYTLTISRDDAGTSTVVWEVSNVNSLLTQYQYPTDGSVAPLEAGNYLWAVTVVDEFGNSCRSKESSFAVR